MKRIFVTFYTLLISVLCVSLVFAGAIPGAIGNMPSMAPQEGHGVIFRYDPSRNATLDFVSRTKWTQTYTGTNRTRINSAGLLETVAANTNVIDYVNGVPYLRLEPAATYYFLNSAAPATQDCDVLAVKHTVCLVGTGSATISAGTATIAAGGAATNGVPFTVNVTGAGTITVTIAGSPTRVWLTNTAMAHSYVVTAGSTVTRTTEANTTTLAIPTAVSNALQEALGSEAITNGDFATNDLTGWTDKGGYTDGSVSAATGAAVFDQGATSETMYIYQAKTVTAGQLYKVTIGSCANGASSLSLRVGTTISGIDVFWTGHSSAATLNGKSYYFTPTASGTVYLALVDAQGIGLTSTWDNISLKPVTRQSKGTLVAEVMFGFSEDQAVGTGGIVAVSNTWHSLLSHNTAGNNNIRSRDDTTNATSTGTDWAANTLNKFAVRWGEINSNVQQFYVSADDGAGGAISNGTKVTYDGAYTVGANLILGYALYGPVWISKIIFDSGILTDTQINAMTK